MAKASEKASEQVEPAPVDDVAETLRRLGAELQAVAGDELGRKAKLAEVEQVLGRLQVKDFPDLAESPVIQQFVKLFGNTEGLKPGETRNRGTLAEYGRDWTWRDLAEFERVRILPRENIPVTFNGLTIYLRDGEEVEVPRPFADIYREHVRALRLREEHENYLLGYTDRPPADRNWVSEESAKVRAWSQMGPTPNARMRQVGPLRGDSGAEEPAEAAANG